MLLEDVLIHKESTVLEGLKKLNTIRDVSRLILFVIDDDEAVIGSLTDGDIRRNLLKTTNLYEKVVNICNRDFLFEYYNKGYLNLHSYRKRDIKILPLLDENHRMKDLIDLEKTRSLLPMECMIMAGGRGKRLSPLTDTIPKPMLPLGEKPIIEHNIDRLISFGIKKIYISVKYLGEHIQNYFGDGSSKGIEIEYVWENEPLGTAGALSLVENFKCDQVLLMNSDLFTNVDFEDLYLDFIKSQADMIVASTEYKVDVPYAVLETTGNTVVNFEEKPSYLFQSNAGIYILRKELIHKIPQNQFYDITTLMEELLKDGGKLAFNPIRGYWIDIGKPVDYKQAQEFVKHLK